MTARAALKQCRVVMSPMVIDFERFSDLADEYVRRIPERFLFDRQGEPIPVIIEPEPQRHPHAPPGVFVLGEYREQAYLPPQISLFYGSFVRLFADEPESVWQAELWETILHEVRHHVEHQAGVFDLDQVDVQSLQAMWEEARRHSKRNV